MRFATFLTLLVLPIFSQAQENAWEQLFQSTFYSNTMYEAGRCNQNVLRYLRLAKKNGLNVSNIEVIEMVNKGISNFGMVGAQNSRGGSELDHTANWFHHVFLKNETIILDFDFTMKPTPTEISTYFKSMYLTNKSKSNKARCLEDLGYYQVTIYTGSDYLRYYDQKVSSDSLNTKKFYLKDSTWACQ